MTYNDICHRLTPLYGQGEARAMARMLLEELTHLTFADILCGGASMLPDGQQERIDTAVARLEQGEPLQYVLGQCQFCGHTFGVAPGVLIPRPETEWLATSAAALAAGHGTRALDIGTGSGCIAASIALDSAAGTYVEAWDISPDALDIARRNAMRLGADVTFRRRNALALPQEPCSWDIIVSNPPYICHRERAAMAGNVTEHEPHLALFVPDDDPLLFYRAIASYASTALRPGGTLLMECNTLYVDDTARLAAGAGLTRVATATDCFGKPRFVSATRGYGI